MHNIPQAIAHLRQMGGDRLVLEAVESFQSEVPARLREARNALRSHDAGSLTRAAHTLRSLAAQMGLSGLAATCRQIEQLGRTRKLSDAPALLSSAEREWAGAKPELQRAVSFALAA